MAKVNAADIISIGNPGNSAAFPTTEVKANTTLRLTAAGVIHQVDASGVKVASSSWNGAHLLLGAYHFWVDATGCLRIKSGAPTSDTDGTVVGSQA
jgi:hypothetical protein